MTEGKSIDRKIIYGIILVVLISLSHFSSSYYFNNKINKLKNENDSLKIINHKQKLCINQYESDIKEIDTLFRNYKNLIKVTDGYLPYNDYFVAISILESGWKNDSRLSLVCNNLVGMRYIKNFEKNKNRNVLGECECEKGYSKYKTVLHNIKDLKNWYSLNPIKPNEDFINYLIRRRYNVENYAYYSKLIRVRYNLK